MIQVRERVGGQEALPREDVFTRVARAGQVQGRLRHVDLAQGGEEGDGGGGRQGIDQVLSAVAGIETGENSENVRRSCNIQGDSAGLGPGFDLLLCWFFYCLPILLGIMRVRQNGQKGGTG